MKKKTFFLLLCCMISLCSSSIAWWSTAHDMIAHIALNKLTPETLKNCDKYLEKLIIYPGCLQASKNTSTFIEASNWCDIIKKYTWKNSENKRVNSLFHHIDIITFPDQKISVKNTIKTINKLLKSNTDEGKYNSYTSLRSSIKTILKTDSSLADKAVAFRFILHVVGDMHEPLHNSTIIVYGIDTDGGGKIDLNKTLFINVLPPPKDITLRINNFHSLWDSAAGLFLQIPYTFHPVPQTQAQKTYISDEGQSIMRSVIKSKSIEKRIKDADIMNWIIENNMLAAEYISNKKLEYFKNAEAPESLISVKFKNYKSYINSIQEISKKQIYLAGCRLANLLNAIFDPQHADKNYVNSVRKIKENKKIPILNNLFPNNITFEI